MGIIAAEIPLHDDELPRVAAVIAAVAVVVLTALALARPPAFDALAIARGLLTRAPAVRVHVSAPRASAIVDAPVRDLTTTTRSADAGRRRVRDERAADVARLLRALAQPDAPLALPDVVVAHRVERARSLVGASSRALESVGAWAALPERALAVPPPPSPEPRPAPDVRPLPTPPADGDDGFICRYPDRARYQDAINALLREALPACASPPLRGSVRFDVDARGVIASAAVTVSDGDRAAEPCIGRALVGRALGPDEIHLTMPFIFTSRTDPTPATSALRPQ